MKTLLAKSLTVLFKLFFIFIASPGKLVANYFDGPEDVSENFGVSHHRKNLKFENFGESQLKLASPGLI